MDETQRRGERIVQLMDGLNHMAARGYEERLQYKAAEIIGSEIEAFIAAGGSLTPRMADFVGR
jgi:hypothetical protein